MTFGPSSSRNDFSEYAPASPWKDTRICLGVDDLEFVFDDDDDDGMAPPRDIMFLISLALVVVGGADYTMPRHYWAM